MKFLAQNSKFLLLRVPEQKTSSQSIEIPD